ncbi:MAG: FecR domain-containing protein [Deltaproteobacteria bacterium]|nr:FecR domain-containing protein [Deltaproteobacteria bacterium]
MDGNETEKPRPPDGDCRRFEELLEASVVDGVEPAGGEREFLERHGAECSECAAFARLLEDLPAMASFGDPAEAARAAGAARRRYARERRRRRIGGVALAAAGLAAVAWAVAVGLRTEPQAKGVALVVTDGRVRAGARVLGPGAEVVSGEAIEVRGVSARLRLGADRIVGLAAGTRLRFDVASDGSLVIDLEEGWAAASVEPGTAPARRVLVRTFAGTVEVLGTVFAVQVSGETVRLDVLRGSVAVRRATAAAEEPPVEAGGSCDLTDGRRMSVDDERRGVALALLGLADDRRVASAPVARDVPPDPVAPVRGSASGSGERVVVAAPPLPVEPPPAPPRVPVPPRHPRAEAGASAPPVAPVVSTPAELMRAARACRTARDWSCAADNYQTLLEVYPDAAEAGTARFALAETELVHLERAAEARALYDEYLARTPSGPLAEEARWGVCMALRALGRAGEERTALEEFLARHPASLRASQARERLGQLVASPVPPAVSSAPSTGDEALTRQGPVVPVEEGETR